MVVSMEFALAEKTVGTMDFGWVVLMVFSLAVKWVELLEVFLAVGKGIPLAIPLAA